MNARDLPQPLLHVARRLTDGTVSARHHAASRARVFDQFAAQSQKKKSATVMTGVVALGVLFAAGTGTAGMIATSRVRTPATPVQAPQAREEIEVSPPEAQIYWDDRPLQGNPAVVSGPADGKRHVVRAEAPGYASESETTKLDGNGSMSFGLQPIPLELGPISSTGPVTDAEAVFERLREPLRACLEIDLVGDVPIAGTATLDVELAPSGMVTAVSVEQVHGFSNRGLACLEAVPRAAEFSTLGKPQKLSVPVTFRGRARNKAK
jgi:hypothetical protein